MVLVTKAITVGRGKEKKEEGRERDFPVGSEQVRARSAVRAAVRARIVNYTGQIERNSCSDDAALTTLRSCDDQR